MWALFFALPWIWVFLLIVVAAVANNYKSVKEMELDIGYVLDVEESEEEVTEIGSKKTFQTITIAETATPGGVNQRRHPAGENTFAVNVGDLIILSKNSQGGILHFKNEH